MKKLLWSYVIVYVFAGCTVPDKSGIDIYKRVEKPPQSISIGMTTRQVSEKLGPPSSHIGKKQYVSGTIDVYHYETYKINYLDDSAAKKEYFFYFWKGRLERWAPPGEWQPEADRLYETLGN